MSKTYNVLNRIEDVVIGTGLCFSIATFESILSIVLLSLNIVLIVSKIVIKVVTSIKNGKVEEAIQTIEDGQKELKDIKKK